MVSRRRLLAATAALPLAGAGTRRLVGGARADDGRRGRSADRGGTGTVARGATALTYNLGLGTNLFAALDATSVDARGVHAHLKAVRDSGVGERMAAIARLIDESGASLVGLQEAALVRRGPRDDGRATEVVVDFLDALTGALAERDAGYRVAAVSRNADVQFPAEPPDGDPFAVRLTDRDVVLVAEDVAVADSASATYAVNVTALVDGRAVSAERGYALAECAVDGVDVTVVSTHLAASSGLIRRAQAAELVGELSGRSGPLVVAADVNDEPGGEDWSAYETLASAFRPAAAADGDVPSSCCQRPELGNERPSLTLRLDELFAGGPARVEASWLVGESPDARVTVGDEALWPSDHAGVAASLSLSPGLAEPREVVRAALWA